MDIYPFYSFFITCFEPYHRYFINCYALELFLVFFLAQEKITYKIIWSFFGKTESHHDLGNYNIVFKFIIIYWKQYLWNSSHFCKYKTLRWFIPHMEPNCILLVWNSYTQQRPLNIAHVQISDKVYSNREKRQKD